MTPETLLNLPRPINELTDEELETHLRPFFPHTRPVKPGNVILEQGQRAGDVSKVDTSDPTSLAAKLAAAYKAAGLDATGTNFLPSSGGISLKRKLI